MSGTRRRSLLTFTKLISVLYKLLRFFFFVKYPLYNPASFVGTNRQLPPDACPTCQPASPEPHHVLDAIRDKATPNPFVVPALNPMVLSIDHLESPDTDLKQPDWSKNLQYAKP